MKGSQNFQRFDLQDKAVNVLAALPWSPIFKWNNLIQLKIRTIKIIYQDLKLSFLENFLENSIFILWLMRFSFMNEFIILLYEQFLLVEANVVSA